MTARHCDTYTNDPTAPEALRAFLKVARSPAHGMGKAPPLYASLKEDVSVRDRGFGPDMAPLQTRSILPAGTRVRVVMASRFGDVGITSDLTKAHGYSARMNVEQLEKFGGAP